MGILVDGKYEIEDLIDLESLSRIFKAFTEMAGLGIGLAKHLSAKVLLNAGCLIFAPPFVGALLQCFKCAGKVFVTFSKGRGSSDFARFLIP